MATTLFESSLKKRVACEIEWEVEIEWKVFNKSQIIPIGTFFFWFIYTLPFETSGSALCGTTGIPKNLTGPHMFEGLTHTMEGQLPPKKKPYEF